MIRDVFVLFLSVYHDQGCFCPISVCVSWSEVSLSYLFVMIRGIFVLFVFVCHDQGCL